MYIFFDNYIYLYKVKLTFILLLKKHEYNFFNR